MRRSFLFHLSSIIAAFTFLTGANATYFPFGRLTANLTQPGLATDYRASSSSQFASTPAATSGTDVLALAPVVENNTPLVVDPEVKALVDAGSVADFWIQLRQTANLAAMPQSITPAMQSTYVYNSMTTIASTSQSRVIAYLKGHGLKYESHWIVNSVLVFGASQADLSTLSTYPEVLEIKGRFFASLEKDENELTPAIQPSSVSSGMVTSQTNWGLDFTLAPQVWTTYNDKGSGIVVANIDTGVQWNHPALINQYRGTITGSSNYNWYVPTESSKSYCGGAAATAPCDWNSHGTHTMGTMVGDDGIPGDLGHHIGMAPQAEWVACMGCDSTTPGSECPDNSLTTCAEWVIAPTDLNGENPDPSKAPNIVNNSWSGSSSGDTWFQTFIQTWVAAGIFPAFSIGNSGPDCSTTRSPGDYPESLGSGAIDSTGLIAYYSGIGPGGFGVLKPDLVAPGSNIISSINNGGYGTKSGTSMASPHTAGAVALLWSAVPALKGKVADTISLLHMTANPNTPDSGSCGGPTPDSSPNYTYGYGYLDAMALVTSGLGIAPTLSFVQGFGKIYANAPANFSIQVLNPPEGTAYPQTRLNVTMKNASVTGISSFDYFDGSAWVPLTLVQSGPDVIGFIGQETGFIMDKGYNQTINFRITWSNPTTYQIIFQLVDLAVPGHVLANLGTTATVNMYSYILPVIMNDSPF